jgi:transposase-like protein
MGASFRSASREWWRALLPALGQPEGLRSGGNPARWKCAGCRKKFSVTSGTLFHSRKLSVRDYLAVIGLFCNGVKGVAALRMARDMNINPKSAFVLLHKLREAMGGRGDRRRRTRRRSRDRRCLLRLPHPPREPQKRSAATTAS